MNLVINFVVFMAGVVVGGLVMYCILCAVIDTMPEFHDDTIQPL